MDFDKVKDCDNLKISYVSFLSKGYIAKNKHLLNEIDLNRLNKYILERCVLGTPIFKIGDSGRKIMVISGVHGNELPPQVASLKLINELSKKEISNTVYIIPFTSPKSSMNNERTFNSMDLNRSAHMKNSLSNMIIQTIEKLKIDFVGDFHSTAYNSNPGFEAVFSSKNPSPESFLIADFISNDVGSESITVDFAGSSYKGAVEDVCNLRGIPAVTCEVLCPFASIGNGSLERSFLQMKSFLSYFGI